MLQVVDNVSLG